MELMVWNVILSFASGLLMLWVKMSHDEVKRLSILLSKTREELSKTLYEKYNSKTDAEKAEDVED